MVSSRYQLRAKCNTRFLIFELGGQGHQAFWFKQALRNYLAVLYFEYREHSLSPFDDSVPNTAEHLKLTIYVSS